MLLKMKYFILFALMVLAPTLSYSQELPPEELPAEDQYVLDFNCSSYLDNGNMITAVGAVNLSNREGHLESAIVDPNMGISLRTLRLKLSNKNVKEHESKSSPAYIVNEFIKGAQLDFYFKVPLKVHDEMSTLIIDGESFELLCEKSIRQADVYPASDY